MRARYWYHDSRKLYYRGYPAYLTMDAACTYADARQISGSGTDVPSTEVITGDTLHG